jgi:hypothetical protein
MEYNNDGDVSFGELSGDLPSVLATLATGRVRGVGGRRV